MIRMHLKRVSVLRVALWHGLYTLIFALLIGLVYSGYAYIVYGRLDTSTLLYYMVGFPVVYCPLGFISYALVAFIYNSVAASGVGIKLEFDGAEQEMPPSPPSF